MKRPELEELLARLVDLEPTIEALRMATGDARCQQLLDLIAQVKGVIFEHHPEHAGHRRGRDHR